MKTLLLGAIAMAVLLTGCAGNSPDVTPTETSVAIQELAPTLVDIKPNGEGIKTTYCGPHGIGGWTTTIQVNGPLSDGETCTYLRHMFPGYEINDESDLPGTGALKYDGWRCISRGVDEEKPINDFKLECHRGDIRIYVTAHRN